ncbi:MAG: Gfo/Idh/MocA family oxidoreductase [Defluviitaleaceae bacterium]|nr:Gfo/Idh/MocA family oxidoreductase [Defluviitaleaceae bacterium]
MRVGLVGLGMMGSAHLTNYEQMKQNNTGIELVAVCDVDAAKLGSSKATEGNLDVTKKQLDLSKYALYSDMEEMIKAENLDYVDLCLPTYLHAPLAIKAMEMGLHVFCEKPMARSSEQCTQMIDAAKRTGKKLMIGHTLRYWDSYMFAKDYVENGTFGKCLGAYFYRGGSTPVWSWDNWLLDDERSGGCLLDQHIHDVDTIVWLFGLPKSVSTSALNVIEGSGFDIVSTNYIYEDGKMVNAQDDWTINGGTYVFSMLFRMNFEKGALVFENGGLTVHPDGEKSYQPKFAGSNAYYDEIILFNKLLKGEENFDYIALLESHRDTIILAEAEVTSAKNKGALQEVKP